MIKYLQKIANPVPKSLFKQKFTVQERRKKHQRIIKGSKEHISIVVQKFPNSKIAEHKPYILIGLNRQCTVYELMNNICKTLEIQKNQSLILFCNKMIPRSNQQIKNLQKQYCEPDGFIYFYVASQQPFGQ